MFGGFVLQHNTYSTPPHIPAHAIHEVEQRKGGWGIFFMFEGGGWNFSRRSLYAAAYSPPAIHEVEQRKRDWPPRRMPLENRSEAVKMTLASGDRTFRRVFPPLRFELRVGLMVTCGVR